MLRLQKCAKTTAKAMFQPTIARCVIHIQACKSESSAIGTFTLVVFIFVSVPLYTIHSTVAPIATLHASRGVVAGDEAWHCTRTRSVPGRKGHRLAELACNVHGLAAAARSYSRLGG